MAIVDSVYRYPVKGLSPERLTRTSLAAGATVPGDRLYAIENGPSGFDPAAPVHQPKQRYLMLMRQENLARLDTHYDDATATLTIKSGGTKAAEGDLRTREGRAKIEEFFAKYSSEDLVGPPKVLHAPNYSFSDLSKKVVSFINLASAADLERILGKPVNPLRFRGNVYVSGWPAWSELDLVGKDIAIGPTARLKIVKRIVRCAATNVDPDTGIRDLNLPSTIMQNFGHADCGIYGEVITAGEIAGGDEIRIVD